MPGRSRLAPAPCPGPELSVGYRALARSRELHARAVPDILGALPGGHFLAVEVKRSCGKLTLRQQNFLDKVSRKGGLAFAAYFVDDATEQLPPNL